MNNANPTVTKQSARAAYQHYAKLVEQLGQEQTHQLDQMINQLEQNKIAQIHQTIEQL